LTLEFCDFSTPWGFFLYSYHSSRGVLFFPTRQSQNYLDPASQPSGSYLQIVEDLCYCYGIEWLDCVVRRLICQMFIRLTVQLNRKAGTSWHREWTEGLLCSWQPAERLQWLQRIKLLPPHGRKGPAPGRYVWIPALSDQPLDKQKVFNHLK
jgi:hypothetical protein